MTAYRKKPVVIEASQWHKPGDHPKVLPFSASGSGPYSIETLEGRMTVTPGDWIITGVKGEHYPCKDEIFKMTYEPADAAQAAPRFPTALRKMWSGGEVQAWIDENWNRRAQLEPAAPTHRTMIEDFIAGLANEAIKTPDASIADLLGALGYVRAAPTVVEPEPVAWVVDTLQGYEFHAWQEDAWAACRGGQSPEPLFAHPPRTALTDAAPLMLEALQAIADFIPKTSAAEGGAAKHSTNVRAADMVRAAIKAAHGIAASEGEGV